MPRKSPFTDLQTYLLNMEQLISGKDAYNLILKYLAGQRVSISGNQSNKGYLDAEKLLKQGMSRQDCIVAMVERYGYKRQWARHLVNTALQSKYEATITGKEKFKVSYAK